MNTHSKKTLLLGTLLPIAILLIVVPLATAMRNPNYDYREDMGYTIESGTRDATGTQVLTPDNCVFTATKESEIENFFTGECGTKFVRVPECVKEENENFASCCEG